MDRSRSVPHIRTPSGAPPAPGLTQTLAYRPTRDLEELESAWDRLSDSLPGVAFYHSWRWHRAVRDHLHEDVGYHCFFEGDDLIAVFPLRATRAWRSGIVERTLDMPAHREIFLADALIHDRYCHRIWTEALLSRVAAEPRPSDVIRFHRVPERSCLRDGLARSDRRLRQVVGGGTAYCDCTTPSALEKLSARHLRNVERLDRHAVRAHGGVEHTWFDDRSAMDEGLSLFMRVEAASWKGPEGTGTSLSCAPEAERFYRSVLESFASTGDARVDVLRIGDAPAAAQIAVRCGATWSLLKIGFDMAFARFGPGNILMKLFIEEMARDPTVDVVSLVTAPAWAARWHMEFEPTHDLAIYAGTATGRLLALGHDARRLARRFNPRAGKSADLDRAANE